MPENFISQLFGGVLASLISQPLIWLLFAVAVAASFLRMFSRNIKGRFGELRISVCPATCSGIVRPGVSV